MKNRVIRGYSVEFANALGIKPSQAQRIGQAECRRLLSMDEQSRRLVLAINCKTERRHPAQADNLSASLESKQKPVNPMVEVRVSRDGVPWNLSELNAIRDNYERLGPDVLAKLMRRSSKAVSVKARELCKQEGISRRHGGWPTEDTGRIEAMMRIAFSGRIA